MTKTLFRVIARDVIGARNLNNPELGLQEGVLYDVVADVQSAKTGRMPEGGSSGYFVRNSETGVVLPQIFKRERFVKEGASSPLGDSAGDSTSSVSGCGESSAGSGSIGGNAQAGDNPEGLGVGDTVVCIDADGARSHSQPETMLEQDEEYRILADVDNAVTARMPSGAAGFIVQRTDDDTVLAGIWNRRRFARA